MLTNSCNLMMDNKVNIFTFCLEKFRVIADKRSKSKIKSKFCYLKKQ